ncbi:MAG: DUF2628 domain-containing protein [Legionella sp.]|nr:DUF2628 domain-containing protein [Legionella sp.]
MQTYTVHEPPNAGADRVDRASELRFVKDGFSWVTAAFPPFGLAASQLWLPLAAYLVFVCVAVAALAALGISESRIAVAVIALHVFMGFEHSTIQRWVLDRDGWTTLGTVNGKTLAECERRFFETWLPAQPMIATGSNAPANSVSPAAWRGPWKSIGSSFGHKA